MILFNLTNARIHRVIWSDLCLSRVNVKSIMGRTALIAKNLAIYTRLLCFNIVGKKDSEYTSLGLG